jgi:hypothetical protein
LHGRFLGEEGTIFLAFAWHQPASAALWRSFAGYLNLGANAATLAVVKLVRTGTLPLEAAPYFTMITALLFQMAPAALILTGRERWLADKWSIIACLLIIALSPMTEEVFANVLRIQFHLALCAALILAFDVPGSLGSRTSYWALLLLGPLCGPGAIVLLPIFALRSLIDKDRGRLAQTFALAAGSAAQLLLFYTSSPLRGHLVDPTTLANILFLRLAAMPYASAPLANLLGRQIYATSLIRGIGWYSMALASLTYFVWLMRMTLRRNDAALWLIAAALSTATVSFGAGMLFIDPSQWFNVTAAQRYNFLPLTLLGIGIVALSMRDRGNPYDVWRYLYMLMLISGAVTFFIPVTDLRHGPDWRSEVAQWRQNHDYKLAVWPKNWLVDLSDRDRPCSKAIVANMISMDPSYCENSWLASVLRDNDRVALPPR